MGVAKAGRAAALALTLAATNALMPARVHGQDWLILQGIAEGEFWASDSGSRLLTHNDGQPGVLGRVRVFVGAAPSRLLQLVALGYVVGGTAAAEEEAELESVTLRATFSRAVVIEGGKLPSPVGAFAPRRLSPTNPLIGEPDGYPTKYPWGGQVSGSIAPFDYRAAIVNLPPVHAGYTPTPKGTPRLVVGGGITPAIGVRLGGTYTRGTYLSDSVTPILPAGTAWKDFHQEVIAFDGRASRGYFDLYAEWAYAWYEVPTIPDRMSGPAYYVELKYTWTPRFFTAARFQRNDYPFVRVRANGQWQIRPANFYAGELGVGFRLTPGVLAKISFQKDHWSNNQPSGQAIAVQLSYQFDATRWLTRRQ